MDVDQTGALNEAVDDMIGADYAVSLASESDTDMPPVKTEVKFEEPLPEASVVMKKRPANKQSVQFAKKEEEEESSDVPDAAAPPSGSAGPAGTVKGYFFPPEGNPFPAWCHHGLA